MLGLCGPETDNDAGSYVMRGFKCLLKSMRIWWSRYLAYIVDIENTKFAARKPEERRPFLLRLWK